MLPVPERFCGNSVTPRPIVKLTTSYYTFEKDYYKVTHVASLCYMSHLIIFLLAYCLLAHFLPRQKLQFKTCSPTFISVINQLDAQNFCFTISLFLASTCFEHMCSSSGGQNCITQRLVSSHL